MDTNLIKYMTPVEIKKAIEEHLELQALEREDGQEWYLSALKKLDAWVWQASSTDWWDKSEYNLAIQEIIRRFENGIPIFGPENKHRQINLIKKGKTWAVIYAAIYEAKAERDYKMSYWIKSDAIRDIKDINATSFKYTDNSVRKIITGAIQDVEERLLWIDDPSSRLRRDYTEAYNDGEKLDAFLKLACNFSEEGHNRVGGLESFTGRSGSMLSTKFYYRLYPDELFHKRDLYGLIEWARKVWECKKEMLEHALVEFEKMVKEVEKMQS